MKYEIAQQLKTREYGHRYANGRGQPLRFAPIKRYEWVVTAWALTWKEAKAQRKTLKGARIYPMREVAA